jgi:hypothetical protein
VGLQHDGGLTLNLTQGTFRLDNTQLVKDFTSATGKLQFNQDTCSSSVSVTDSVPIIRNSGTGIYKGISGIFRLTATLDEVVPKKAGCDVTGAMLGQAIVVTGYGKVFLK